MLYLYLHLLLCLFAGLRKRHRYKEAMLLESTSQEEEDAIGPAGIFKLCQDLSLEPDSVPSLSLSPSLFQYVYVC